MSRPTKYVLDANTFMQANRQYYPFDICPGFWKGLLVQHANRRIYSIDRIKAEIAAGNDQLKQWAISTAPKAFFSQTADKTVIDKFAEMVEWVQNEPQYTDEAKAQFAGVADGWLAAYACCNQVTVVTQEVYSSEAKMKVPLPNVCRKFDVEYINTFDMLRQLGVQLVLRTKRQRKK